MPVAALQEVPHHQNWPKNDIYWCLSVYWLALLKKTLLIEAVFLLHQNGGRLLFMNTGHFVILGRLSAERLRSEGTGCAVDGFPGANLCLKYVL
jgi:hypothetical protein